MIQRPNNYMSVSEENFKMFLFFDLKWSPHCKWEFYILYVRLLFADICTSLGVH